MSKENKDRFLYKKWLQTTFLDGIIDNYEKCILVSKRLQNVIDDYKDSSTKERNAALLEEIQKLKEEKILN